MHAKPDVIVEKQIMQGVCMCVFNLVRNFVRRMLQHFDLSTNHSNTIQIRALIDGLFDFDWLDR